MIRAVLFDLDGTLYDRDLLVQKLAEEQFIAFQDELHTVGKERFVQRVIALDDHGYGDKQELYKQVAIEWSLSAATEERLRSHFWSAYTRHCVPGIGAHATLQALQDHGIRLGVITNGQTDWQQQKLDSLGIASFFDTVLISEKEGIRKPDRAIFERALDRLRVSPAESVFVGDNPAADVAGAQASGMIPIWKYVPYWAMTSKGVITVKDLSEIVPICLELRPPFPG